MIPQIPSPDRNGNPYCFFFKNNKIEMDSGIQLLINLIAINSFKKMNYICVLETGLF